MIHRFGYLGTISLASARDLFRLACPGGAGEPDVVAPACICENPRMPCPIPTGWPLPPDQDALPIEDDADLPQRLSHEAIRSGADSLQSAVQTCCNGYPTPSECMVSGTVDLTVEGVTGRVRSANLRNHTCTDTGQRCVAAWVNQHEFPRFVDESQRLTYTLNIRGE
jgi:hypothetical protein